MHGGRITWCVCIVCGPQHKDMWFVDTSEGLSVRISDVLLYHIRPFILVSNIQAYILVSWLVYS